MKRGGDYLLALKENRPTTFADLIGQEVLVRTLTNAMQSGRLAHAFLLTGIRGIGKTTTARILARAFNYELPSQGINRPTVDMPELGVHCQAIIESRHVDVIEMDAASNRGVDEMVQLLEQATFLPSVGRYKVYMIDEVHQLTAHAFNAMLKTLENRAI